MRNKTFNSHKFKFSIKRIIDGRIDKKEPVAIVPSAWNFGPHSIGNDTIESELNHYFSHSRNDFDANNPIAIVVNQIHFTYGNTISFAEGEGEVLNVTLALDYYSIKNDSCRLIYKQYYRYIQVVTAYRPVKAINIAFSQGLLYAFTEFNNQLRIGKLPNIEVVSPSKFDSIAVLKEQKVDSENIKDGVYFSSKDLFLNRPAVIPGLRIDTTKLGFGPVSVSSNSYIIDRVYAIVKGGRIFIYLEENYYKEALMDGRGLLYFSSDLTNPNLFASSYSINAPGIRRWINDSGGIVQFATNPPPSPESKRVERVNINYNTGAFLFEYGKVH